MPNGLQYALGNGRFEQSCFNSRLQPKGMRIGSIATTTNCSDTGDLLNLGFTYGGTNNNGNLLSQVISQPGVGVLTQSYIYDDVNRLQSATEAPTSWTRGYGYDRYGNRWVSSANDTLSMATPTAQGQFSASTNRLTASFDGVSLPGTPYDPAGNLTEHPFVGKMVYDGENKQRFFCPAAVSTCDQTTAAAEYEYDDDGNRVKKVEGSATTVFVYDAFGNLAAEYATAPDPNLTAGTFYRTLDHLGSTRLVTDAAGAVVTRRDFFPFGEEIDASASFGNRQLQLDGGSSPTYNQPLGIHQKFTGKERDGESGLDYFLARYYSAPMGRFTSPDETLLDQQPNSPQSWNLYPYVRNNPLRFFDPTGATCVDIGNGNLLDVDGPGGTCADALAGDIEESNNPSMTVTAQGPPSPQLLAVSIGTQRAKPVVDAAAAGTFAIVAGGTLAMIADATGGLITLGLFEESAVVAALSRAASSPGATVLVVTTLSQAPQAGRALSVATGPNAQALVRAVGTDLPPKYGPVGMRGIGVGGPRSRAALRGASPS